MIIRAKVTGLRDIKRQLGKYQASARKALESAIYIEAETIMTKSKRLVPVDTGALRSTGHVKPPETTMSHIVVTMGYGGPAKQGGGTNQIARILGVGDTEPARFIEGQPRYVGYAVYVHEDLTAYHTPPQQAKYLSTPIKKAKRGMGSRIVRRVNTKLKLMGFR